MSVMVITHSYEKDGENYLSQLATKETLKCSQNDLLDYVKSGWIRVVEMRGRLFLHQNDVIAVQTKRFNEPAPISRILKGIRDREQERLLNPKKGLYE